MTRCEKTFKKIMEKSNLFLYSLDDAKYFISNINYLINPRLTGEAALTIRAALTDVLHHHCGVVAIGPFRCMPNRLSEAILSREMDRSFPSWPLKGDGNLFPQVSTAKLKVFLLQAFRIHEDMRG